MSWFKYGEHANKPIGVWLRYESNKDIIDLIKASKQKRWFDNVQRVIVSEYYKDENQVLLEVWCKNIIDSIKGKLRYNVFYVKTTINPDWICEGDLGAGAVDFWEDLSVEVQDIYICKVIRKN